MQINEPVVCRQCNGPFRSGLAHEIWRPMCSEFCRQEWDLALLRRAQATTAQELGVSLTQYLLANPFIEL